MRYLTILLFLFLGLVTLAQKKPLSPLDKMVIKLTKAKSIAFHEQLYEKSLFSNDTLESNIHKRLFFGLSGKVIAADISHEREHKITRNVFANNWQYYLASDSTYTVKEATEYSGGFGDLFTKGGIIENIITLRKNIVQLNDTLIHGNPCYQYKINIQDTLIDGEREFTYKYISIDKKSYLPLTSVYSGHGVIMKDGVKIGSLDLFSRSSYNQMKLNTEKNDLLDFQLPNWYLLQQALPLLKEGVTAPTWSGLDVDGNHYASKQLEGKIQVLFLSDINCPANQLSISMLNKLTGHYKNQAVQIVGIYPENKAKIKSYRQSNPLKFPVLYDGMSIKNTYHAPGAPFFYIIDPMGKIVKSVVGYSADWQQQFTAIIDKLLEH